MPVKTFKPEAPPPASARPAIGLRDASPAKLQDLNRRHGWSLNAAELAAICRHFRSVGREPSRAEMETIAQTWSEHCKHKTFTGEIRYREGGRTLRFGNLLRETVMEATRRLKKPWCLSVFKDNAGVVAYDQRWALAFKVETHNHPCALEPYGGASTGVGGVIRDILGVGLGAKPVLGTDVFCLCPPDGADPVEGPAPRLMLERVVAGVRDYGNRMGIPTSGGAIWFDEAFRFNPLVFCGSVGLLPRWAVRKEVRPGDVIVAVGGRTGKDGLHGATFSSSGLHGDSPSSAVQIGHAIMEKRMLDVLLKARDAKLLRSVTDCGAGGFSSAIGELGAGCGARVKLDEAKLKVQGLEPWEIWLSESQERMILACPPKNLKALLDLFDAEDVEYSLLGEFTADRRLKVEFRGETVIDLPMSFLHEGLPKRTLEAQWNPPPKVSASRIKSGSGSCSDALYALLSHWNVCSRAWVIRQYDHEVQGGAVIKALQGTAHDGPGDACVHWPHAATGEVDGFSAVAIAHGLNPNYGRLDPYAMALCCADEALRNLVSVGADVSRASFLDNFCWGNPEDPRTLGSLVRAALGCRDAALGYQVPFISGKDSLYNEYRDARGNKHSIPGTLLISAVAPVDDFRKALTLDFKAPGNAIYLVGWTAEEMGGSLYSQWRGDPLAGAVPLPYPKRARACLRLLSAAIAKGLVSACHDLSEGGLGVAAAEMAFSGEIGALLELDEVCRPKGLHSNEAVLFSESPSRFLVEVACEKEKEFLKAMKGAILARVGSTLANPVLRIKGTDGSALLEEPLAKLKEAWIRTLPLAMLERRNGAHS